MTVTVRWRRALKSSLGDVWHAERVDVVYSNARCDARIRLHGEPRDQDTPPTDVYLCKRCKAIVSVERT